MGDVLRREFGLVGAIEGKEKAFGVGNFRDKLHE